MTNYSNSLKYIHLLSAGIDHFVNHPILTDSDIPISTSSGIHGPAITEWILLTTLALHKNFALMQKHQKAHKWASDELGLSNSWDWEGKTIGIMGYGSIGRQGTLPNIINPSLTYKPQPPTHKQFTIVPTLTPHPAARVYSAMGSKIHAYTATPRSTPESRHNTSYQLPNTGDPNGTIPTAWYSGTDKPSLHTFLSSGLDMLIISVPLTPSTRSIISDPELDVLYRASLEKLSNDPSRPSQSSSSTKLEPHTGTILVNISRGPVLSTPSLLRALHPSHISEETGRKLLGACLDVTDPEPLPPDHELWDCPDVVITPHIAALGREYLERSMGVLVENLGRRERGEGMVNLVGRRRGY